jgi:hypothetical protein
MADYEDWDGRENNGHDRKRMLRISKNGTVSAKHFGHSVYEHGSLPADKRICPLKKRRVCGCQQSCRLIENYREELTTQIMSLSHMQSEDLHMVREYVRCRAFQAVIDMYISQQGLLQPNADGELDAIPVMKGFYPMIANRGDRLARELGLTPLARKELEKKGKASLNDYAKAIHELQEVNADE